MDATDGDPTFWVLVLNYNGLADTRRCLHSLAAQQGLMPRVLVIDNASAVNPIPQLQAEFPHVQYLQSGANLGYAGGNNVGIRHALAHNATTVVLLNNDTVVAPDLCQRLRGVMRARPNLGIVGPVIHHMNEPLAVQTEGVTFNPRSYAGFFCKTPVTHTPGDSVVNVDIVNGCCMAIRSSVFERVGLIDEDYFLIHEESDFCLRAQQAGFGLGVLNRGLVWHKQSESFKRTGHGRQRYYDSRNLLRLVRAHAGKAGSRGKWSSLWTYVRHLHHRYCLECEAGESASAQAILHGLHDALTNDYGPHSQQPRRYLPLLTAAFTTAYWASRAVGRVTRGGR